MDEQNDLKSQVKKNFKDTSENRTNEDPEVDEQNKLRSEENLKLKIHLRTELMKIPVWINKMI